jgi:hypothetical protein
MAVDGRSELVTPDIGRSYCRYRSSRGADDGRAI